MDRAIVGLILTAILGGAVAGSCTLYWLLEQTLRIRIERKR